MLILPREKEDLKILEEVHNYPGNLSVITQNAPQKYK